MLDVVFGQTKKKEIAQEVKNAIETLSLDGTLYFGYPVLASSDEKVDIDALLVTNQHGLIALIFASEVPAQIDQAGWDKIVDKEDKLFFALETSLARHEGLRDRRKLAFEVTVATVFPTNPAKPIAIKASAVSLAELPDFVSAQGAISEDKWKLLQAALQKVTNIKPPKKRTNVNNPNSKGAILRKIEKEIANLDQWQKKAAIETPDAPQRIRGLAGSGKTIVLALKAAYLHSLHPNWNIAVVFHSRALHPQFVDLIRRFCFEHLNDEPNWEKLQILNAWGGANSDGVYSQIATHAGLPVRNYMYAKTAFGMDNAFKGVCGELLSITANQECKPLYDAILIDEAQDLPPEFFQLIYKFTSEPKRIVWAYDELQKISESAMPSTLDLFGKDSNGQARVKLDQAEGKPRQDITLPVCYRNPPWTLSLAHGLGFGTARKSLVQHFDDLNIWSDIGYRVVSGTLDFGQKVILERSSTSYPDYFHDLLTPQSSINNTAFPDQLQQAEWIAASIEKNLNEDELEHDDILIVLPSAQTAKSESRLIMQALARRNIDSHLAGVTSDRDEFFIKNSITLAHIYRSKGNEAPVVYLVNAQNCDYDYELATKRNILFTAITRSRAWVNISGISPSVDGLFQELEKIRQNNFKLEFKIPTREELEKMRKIHGDKTVTEKQQIKGLEKGLKNFLEAVQAGLIAPDQLPAELRANLTALINQDSQDDDF